MMWSENTLQAAYNFGYACAQDGHQCMFTFVDGVLQAKYEEGYSKRYEEEQQLTNQIEEQESGN